MSGLRGLKYTIALFRAEAQMLFREAPMAIQTTGIEALIVDQGSFVISTVADRLQLPFVTICNALPELGSGCAAYLPTGPTAKAGERNCATASAML